VAIGLRRRCVALAVALSAGLALVGASAAMAQPGPHTHNRPRLNGQGCRGAKRAQCRAPAPRRRASVVCFWHSSSGVRVCRPRLSRNSAARSVVARPRLADLTVPCPDTQLIPSAANVAAVDAATVCLVNQVRAQHGVAAMRFSTRLAQAAQRHAADMVASDYFGHVGPAGDTPVSRIRDTGYLRNTSVGYVVGENLAWGTLTLATPAATVAAWIASPEHLSNMLDPGFADTAVYVDPQAPPTLSQGQPGATYAQEFGGVSR
jgi:uncharacterized protein YkwD